MVWSRWAKSCTSWSPTTYPPSYRPADASLAGRDWLKKKLDFVDLHLIIALYLKSYWTIRLVSAHMVELDWKVVALISLLAIKHLYLWLWVVCKLLNTRENLKTHVEFPCFTIGAVFKSQKRNSSCIFTLFWQTKNPF